MIDRKFWKDAKNAWCVSAQPETEIPQVNTRIGETTEERPQPAPQLLAKPKPLLNTEAFDNYIDKKDLPSYVECCKLLMKCCLPAEMEEIYVTLADRMTVLQEAIQKFQKVYQADMTGFYDYYIPEALQLTATYLEYENAGIDREIIESTKAEVFEAARSLLTAVNDKIDEIYKFASLEIQAQAKALAQLMGQDGYVDPALKIK